MRPPFPGMDPYLEHPALWPDVHNRFVAAIADALSPLVAPQYYVGVERRTYLLSPGEISLSEIPDASVIGPAERTRDTSSAFATAAEVSVLSVEVPIAAPIGEYFLEIREPKNRRVVTALELLPPANKIHARGRRDYEEKRHEILASRTNLVDIDLPRAGEPMAMSPPAPADKCYRILVSPSRGRPRASLLAFGVRQPIPSFRVPLRQGDTEPDLDLGKALHALYDRARFDLLLDYGEPPTPPLDTDDARWARELVGRAD